MENIFNSKADKNRFREILKEIENQGDTVIILESFTAGLLTYTITKLNEKTVESSYIPRSNVSFQETIQHAHYE